MDWKLAATTAATVFVAELGDKTQLTTVSLASSSSSRLAVFLGSATGLVASAAVAVLAASAIARLIPPVWLQRGAGVLFLGLGAFTLWRAREGV